jgi:hypothetical protein
MRRAALVSIGYRHPWLTLGVPVVLVVAAILVGAGALAWLRAEFGDATLLGAGALFAGSLAAVTYAFHAFDIRGWLARRPRVVTATLFGVAAVAFVIAGIVR